jgi:hypothetical protein
VCHASASCTTRGQQPLVCVALRAAAVSVCRVAGSSR